MASLVSWGRNPDGELLERCCQRVGKEYSSPLLDRRVVQVALSLPLEHRIPVPSPKPLLSRAFLDGFEKTRRKARFTSYFERLADSLRREFPWIVSPDSVAARRGFVRRDRLAAVHEPRWRLAVLPMATLEAWLRCA
jgi:hypothetical protein